MVYFCHLAKSFKKRTKLMVLSNLSPYSPAILKNVLSLVLQITFQKNNIHVLFRNI